MFESIKKAFSVKEESEEQKRRRLNQNNKDSTFEPAKPLTQQQKQEKYDDLEKEDEE